MLYDLERTSFYYRACCWQWHTTRGRDEQRESWIVVCRPQHRYKLIVDAFVGYGSPHLPSVAHPSHTSRVRNTWRVMGSDGKWPGQRGGTGELENGVEVGLLERGGGIEML